VTGDLLRRPAHSPGQPPGPARSPAPAPPGAPAPSRRAAAALAGALSAAGTRLLFGLPGGGPNLDVIGAAADAGLRFVLAHGETAAAIMAATYADLTGSPGAVVVTRGPGLASAVNGITHAALDRLPLVVIADTVPAGDRDRISHQRLDQNALGQAVAKATLTLGGDQARRAADLAVRLALAPPAGPVVVNVDPGAQASGDGEWGAGAAAGNGGLGTGAAAGNGGLGTGAAAGNGGLGTDAAAGNGGLGTGAAAGSGGLGTDAAAGSGGLGTDAGAGNGRPGAEAEGTGADPRDNLAPLADALRAARRPVVLLGLGALGHAGAVRAALAGHGIPALHTYRARGLLPDSGAEAAGLFTGGTMESPLLAAADLIIGLGVDPVELIPAAWDYPARTLLVTEYPAGSAGYFTGSTELVAPLPAALDVLANRHGGHRWPPAAGRTAKQDVTARLGRAAVPAPGSLTPQDVVTTARAQAPPEAVVTVDSGAHMLAVMPLWPVDEPRRLLISSGLATMGYALPAAIGAALHAPDAPVIAFTGDGGLGMTLMEVETAVRHRLRVIVVVFNDAALSLIKIKQSATGQGGAEAVGYARTSFAAAATAMGAAAASVTDREELATALAAALAREGPTLIDARVDPAGYPALLDLTRGDGGRRADQSGSPPSVMDQENE
jgi:acetolactate synthase I/II/III large subunit